MTASDRQASIEVDKTARGTLGLDLAQPRVHRSKTGRVEERQHRCGQRRDHVLVTARVCRDSGTQAPAVTGDLHGT